MSIFDLLFDIVYFFATSTLNLIKEVFISEYFGSYNFETLEVNLSLFSDTPIFTTNMHDLLLLFFTIFYTMFFIILLYKATKKFINMVFGVFRV